MPAPQHYREQPRPALSDDIVSAGGYSIFTNDIFHLGMEMGGVLVNCSQIYFRADLPNDNTNVDSKQLLHMDPKNPKLSAESLANMDTKKDDTKIQVGYEWSILSV